jgi:4-diphosphocytidyl-2-C-methyl-D-erythritol kinase
MYSRRSGLAVQLWAPAKLNLLLEVSAKRSDGFHEIVTLMTAVRLFDTLWIVPDLGGELQLSCEWAGPMQAVRQPEKAGVRDASLGDLPEGPDNIVWRALSMLRERAGVGYGARVRLVKRIPSAAGLGGASSDAAAALLGANVVWQLGWTGPQLAELAAELGSDVPFFLGPPAAVCRGRGERIEPVADLAPLHFVLVRPPDGLSTPRVYGLCRPAPGEVPVDALLAALRRGEVARAGGLMGNRLQEPAESLSPWVGRLRREFADTDCVAHQMSGSGTSYFGICRHARHARRVADRLRGRRVGRVYCTQSIVAYHHCC